MTSVSVNNLWLEPYPLVLASGSSARRVLLNAAAIPLEIIKPEVDEGTLATRLMADSAQPKAIAEALALAKAQAVSAAHPDRLIVAADQTLDFEGQLGMKAPDLATAKAQLQALRGKTHALHSAAVLMRGGEVIWAGVESAHLTMRPFSNAFLDHYLALMGEKVLGTVGAYELEALGVHLFAKIDGAHPVILGLPLSGLLEALRDARALLG